MWPALKRLRACCARCFARMHSFQYLTLTSSQPNRTARVGMYANSCRARCFVWGNHVVVSEPARHIVINIGYCSAPVAHVMDANPAQQLPQDAWAVVAAHLVERHALRSVYDVARDLACLQLVCKGSSQCADDAWPAVVLLCSRSHVKVSSQVPIAPCPVDLLSTHLAKHDARPARWALEWATKLPKSQLPVCLQYQTDKHAQI